MPANPDAFQILTAGTYNAFLKEIVQDQDDISLARRTCVYALADALQSDACPLYLHVLKQEDPVMLSCRRFALRFIQDNCPRTYCDQLRTLLPALSDRDPLKREIMKSVP